MATATRCSVNECDRQHYGRGLCHMHYQRLKKTGRLTLRTVEERFWDRVEKTDSCWTWRGSYGWYGYGQVQIGKSMRRAHRVAFEWLVGPVPKGLVLDHLCRNRGCVNPSHLEPVTQQVNTLRGAGPAARNANKAHCKWGHEFTPENTGVDKRGKRWCKTCSLRRGYEHRALYGRSPKRRAS